MQMLHVPSLNYKRIFLAVAVIGLIIFGWWTISPLFIDRVVNEPLMEAEDVSPAPLTYRTGSFKGSAGHSAEGMVQIINRGNDIVVRFEDDFVATNGPDLHVYFGNDGEYDPQAYLGPLKGNIGSQNYVIPGKIDYAKYSEVWIWCRAFRTPFAVAKLQ